MNEHVTSYSTVQEFRVSELVNGKNGYTRPQRSYGIMLSLKGIRQRKEIMPSKALGQKMVSYSEIVRSIRTCGFVKEWETQTHH